MVSISLDKTLEEAKKWSQEFNATFPVIFDPTMKTALEYGVDPIPVNFAIDGSGTVVGGHTGFDEPELYALARQLLRWKEGAPAGSAETGKGTQKSGG